MKIRVLCASLVFALPLFPIPSLRAQDAPASTPTATAAQPFTILGSWKLALAKCDFGDGPKLRDMVVKVTSATPDLIDFSITATYDSGSQGSYSFKAPADGKDHALSGSASTYSYTSEGGTLTETQKDPDGTVTKGTWALSKTGKEGIWTYTITNPDGSVTHQKIVLTKTA